VGGLIVAAAFSFYVIAYGVPAARRTLGLDPRVLIGVGLMVAVGSGLWSVFHGRPFMTGMWTETPVPVLGKLGTPFLFDVGVYLVVIGVMLTIIFSLAEE
jgi:multicomponent Na+:H+ antiporter subunit B